MTERRALPAGMTPRRPSRDPRLGEWIDGLADWVEGDTAYLSVAFTWRIDDAYTRAIWHRALGRKVIAGGPALFLPKMRRLIESVAQVGDHYPDAIARHNPQATFASRGCPVGCSFCIVPAMEGLQFTMLPDFPVRPVLCDNNLSALPAEYQDHIVERYLASGIQIMDASSGFEPRTFDDEVFARWRVINKGPWRFAYDETRERADVERVMRMLRRAGVRPRRIQVYTLVGNEPFASCKQRVDEVVAWGGEPYAQPYIKLNALEKRPHVRFDWTEGKLKRFQRWCNYSRRSGVTWEEYNASVKTSRRDDSMLDLFTGMTPR
jgi:hypothetical protein